MSTLSIIAISVLAAIFSLLLLAAIATLVYVYLLVRKQIAEFTSIVTSTGVKLDTQFDRLDKLIAGVRGDQISKAASAILDSIPKQSATAVRMEQAVTAFTNALKILTGEREQEITEEAIQRARASGLGPESYAPESPDGRYVGKSRSAIENERAREQESADNTIESVPGTIAGLNTFGSDED